MNGELAQVGALVAFGNAWLSSSISAVDDFEGTNSTFRFVRSVTFEIASSSNSQELSSVREWCEAARDCGVERFALLAGGGTPTPFVNQGSWGIAGLGARLSMSWWGTWNVNWAGFDPAEVGAPIWEVRYRAISRARRTELPSLELDRSSDALRHSLTAARDFTIREPALKIFGRWFEDALALFEIDEPSIEYHPDLLPAVGYSVEARRLVAAAVRSWVFGGMGSWNDMGFSDPTLLDAYRTVSENLYTSVIEGFRDGVNSFEFAHRHRRRRWYRR